MYPSPPHTYINTRTHNTQVLTVSTTTGELFSYLAALPTVYAAAAGRLAHLTSLSELAVLDCLPGGSGLASRLQVRTRDSIADSKLDNKTFALCNSITAANAVCAAAGSTAGSEAGSIGAVML